MLFKAGISAVRWAKGEDIEALAVATGARIVARFEDLSSDKLGFAESVEVIDLGANNDRVMVIKGFKSEHQSKICTLFIRGGNGMLLDEARRSLHDAMCVVRNLIKEPKVVYGGGASEMNCALAVSKKADTVGTTEQFALRKYAEALDCIPLSLARNSGL